LEYFDLGVITVRQSRNAENNQVNVEEKYFVIEYYSDFFISHKTEFNFIWHKVFAEFSFFYHNFHTCGSSNRHKCRDKVPRHFQPLISLPLLSHPSLYPPSFLFPILSFLLSPSSLSLPPSLSLSASKA
jgi:hypothetical protein